MELVGFLRFDGFFPCLGYRPLDSVSFVSYNTIYGADCPRKRAGDEMRHKDSALMKRILEFVERFYMEKDRSPSTTEIAYAVHIARSSAHRYLVAMNENRMLQYDGTSITTRITRLKSETRPAEVYSGAIPCGSPEMIEASIEEIVPLPVSIFGDGELYVIRTNGDSMVDAGIDSADLVVIRKQDHANVGDIVVALYQNENTLKRLRFDEQTQRYILHPENPDMKDIVLENAELRVQGVATFVIKAL